MRDYAETPAWAEEDLGVPLPDSPHACSVCLPTWDAVIGYEENRDKVTRRMRTGYPRFFRHPTVERLFTAARTEVATDGEDVLVLPTRGSVLRAHRWIERRAEAAVRIASFHGLQVLIFPIKARPEAISYWRFAGEGVSSRQAQDFLDGKLRDESKSNLVARAVAKYVGVPAEHAFVFASGMAAVVAVLRCLQGLRENRKTLQLEFPYVDCLKVQELFGQGVVYLNDASGESFEEALQRIRRGEFAGVFTEVPSNPLLRCVDLERIAEACRSGSTPLIVDDSTVGPLNVEAVRYADIVTSSLTKWISGIGDVMAGMASVRPDSPFAEALRPALLHECQEISPLYVGDAEVLLSNVRSYAGRNDHTNASGSALAAWLAAHPAVESVWHPSLDPTGFYEQIRRKGGGHGGLLSFALKSARRTPKVFDSLKLSKGPSFGTPFTLVCPYTMLAHYRELEWTSACGVPSHLLRVSCGLEPIDRIIAAFDEALVHG